MQILLNYLCENNPHWKQYKIQLNSTNLSLLPEDAIPNDLNYIPDESNFDQIIKEKRPEIQDDFPENDVEDDTQTFVENNQDGPLQIDLIKQKLQWPQVNPFR